jgi:hypothetical protein
VRSNENADVAVLQANQLSNKIGCYLCQSKKIYNIQVADEGVREMKVKNRFDGFSNHLLRINWNKHLMKQLGVIWSSN